MYGLTTLLVGGAGFSAFVWLTPDPVRFGSYALVGPNYTPRVLVAFSYITDFGDIEYPVNGRVASPPPARSPAKEPQIMGLDFAGPNAPMGVEPAKVLWEWGELRWTRIEHE